MIPRRNRLTRASFPGGSGGNRRTSPHFSALIGEARVGGIAAVISKKVARRSVDRHLLKRRILAILAPYALPGQYLVVYARAGAPSLSFSALKQEITNLLSR